MQTNVTYKAVGAITDNDVGKAVKISATDTVELCADGDPIYGFINSVEIGTEDGAVVVTVCIKGRVRVTLDGIIAIGAVVEAGAQEAAGTAKAGNWANVSTHTAAAGEKNWVLISGAGTDGTDGTVEYV
jgi:hypothetical protein